MVIHRLSKYYSFPWHEKVTFNAYKTNHLFHPKGNLIAKNKYTGLPVKKIVFTEIQVSKLYFY